MARLPNPRTVFAFTSPRTIEKIIPEIRILIDTLHGRVWNETSQTRFFDELYNSEFYDGDNPPQDKAFAARDRITRAPKALGFVDLKPAVSLTAAGERLLSGHRTHEVFAKQLFKFQLPSPYHTIPPGSRMNIRPYLELLRLVSVLGDISKREIAIFFVPMINHSDFHSVVDEILAHRAAGQRINTNRKAWIQDRFDEKLKQVYAAEITAGNFSTRESGERTLSKFLATKRSNHNDYADALVRYLRATQLITFDPRSYRVIVSPAKRQDVDFILENVDPQALTFRNEADFKRYMFNPDELQLLTDSRTYLAGKLDELNARYDPGEDVENLKDILEQTEISRVEIAIGETEVSLKNYQEFDDVMNVFEKIQNKEVPDAPLFLEWNVWRSMVMINFVKNIKPNFTFDFDGFPLNTAQGNKPDIEAEYDGFNMIIEVTMSSGNTQFNMEGESVARHFGNIQRDNPTPAYCIFIAPNISEGALAHFFNLNRFPTKFYGGKTRIIPMSLRQFIQFITTAKDKGFKDPRMLKAFLDGLIEHNQTAGDEAAWYDHIGQSIPDWVSA